MGQTTTTAPAPFSGARLPNQNVLQPAPGAPHPMMGGPGMVMGGQVPHPMMGAPMPPPGLGTAIMGAPPRANVMAPPMGGRR